jgi:RNA polymerase sigma-70 factor (ECF subfamily)
MRRDLVERAMAHDHEAFSELARLTIDKLYAIARLITHDVEQAEDAVQEALVAAWRDIAALRDPDRFEAWLHRLLVRACYREAGRNRVRRNVELHIVTADRGVPDASRALADRDELERGFRRLTPEQRALIVMHHYVGLPLAEVADSLGLPLGTVKSRLFRATQTMRAALDADARTSGHVEERTA